MKNFLITILILLGCSPVFSQAGAAMLTGGGSWVANPPAFQYLQNDLGTDLVSVYSLRLTDSTYAGNAIEVRRSSDNTYQDIGFIGDGELDTVSLKSFCGASNCFVRTFYDQDSTFNLIQNSTTFQPRIVNGGVIDRSNGKPAIYFNGSLNIMTVNAHTTLPLSDFTIISVSEPVNASTNAGLYGFDGTDDIIFYANDPNAGSGGLRVFWRDMGANLTSEAGSDLSGTQLIYAWMNSGTIPNFGEARRNGVSVDTWSGSGLAGPFTAFQLGAWTTQYANTYVQEISLWNADKTANISDIESNITSYFNTY